MSEPQENVNKHIEEYLDYYYELSDAPGFAVLLNGQWGSGKTWFINKFLDKKSGNNKRDSKHYYISLYGMATITDIEDKFFQLLNPIMSSKGMAVAGIIFKGLLKGALKIDLNNDGKDDGTWAIQIPDIKLSKSLEKINKSVLVFDDIERCNIDLNILLGYINYFLEHQGLKVILIANEDKLIENKTYNSIKEKIIGKNFTITPDFEGALCTFIDEAKGKDLDNKNFADFLYSGSELIKRLYSEGDYINLRSLKQIVLDFQRIFEALPEKAKTHHNLLEEILKLLVAFSIEIKRGNIKPKELLKLENYSYREPIDRYISQNYIVPLSNRKNPSTPEVANEEKNRYKEILNKYSLVFLHKPFPSIEWWQTFFEKGFIDKNKLEESVLNSKYFQDENTPNWLKLWHFLDLSDNDFDILIEQVSTNYYNREFSDLGEIIHIFGLLLTFSHYEIYPKSKEDILEDAKKYINNLKAKNQLGELPQHIRLSTSNGDSFGVYKGLGFWGKDFQEFKEFYNYIEQVQDLSRREKVDEFAQAVLDAMQNDVSKFDWMICHKSIHYEYKSEPRYLDIPILKYISPNNFMENFLSLKNEDQGSVFESIVERHKDGNGKLIEELEWLESIQVFLLQESDSRKRKLSGYLLKRLDEIYLREVIEILKQRKEKLHN